jgi:hypothetical protein
MIDHGVANCNREARAQFFGLPVGRTHHPGGTPQLSHNPDAARVPDREFPAYRICPYELAVVTGLMANKSCFSAFASSAKFFWLSTDIIFSWASSQTE